MKYIYHNANLRAKITKRKPILAPEGLTITLQIRKRWWKFTWWQQADRELIVDLEEYWTLFSGPKEEQRVMHMSTNFGDRIEVWYPQAFNLRKRVDELFFEYLENNRAVLHARLSLKKQLEKL